MTIPHKYLHDRLILLLLSTNIFLAFIASIFMLLRLGANHSNGYIVQYRPALGITAYQSGSMIDMLAFVGFALLVVFVHTILSIKTYQIHRQLSVVILGLGVVLLILTIIVSNALLVLR